MKSILRIFLFIIPVLILVDCRPITLPTQTTQGLPLPSFTTSPIIPPSSSILQPTETAFLPSIPTATLTVIPLLISTPTPIETLQLDVAKQTIQPLSNEPMNCGDVPCFWGIIPGKTHFDDASNFLHSLGFTPFEGKDPNYPDRYFYTIEYPSESGPDNNVTLFTKNDNLVENIVVTPRIAQPKEGGPRVWLAYSQETLIKQFGKPSRVEFALDWGPNFVITMVMYFDTSNMIALYSGYNMIPDRPQSPQVCPLTAPFDHIRLWMGPNPPNPPLTGSSDQLEKSVPLEKATSLTIDQFTQLMMGNPKQACFIVNGNVFK